MNAHSFTSGADYRDYAATMTGFGSGCSGMRRGLVAPDGKAPCDFLLRVDLGSPIPEMEPTNKVAPDAPRSNGLRDRVIGAATAKKGVFAITINGDTIGVIAPVDLERAAPEWKVMARSGVFTGSFIITL